MTEQELIDAVRAECGKITVAMDEVDDPDIIRYGQKILKIMGEKITVKTVRYITSEADEREYAVPSDVLRVQQIFPWDAIQDEFDFGQTSVVAQYSGGIVSDFEFPSLWKIKMMRKMRGLPRVQHEYDPINRKLKIDPAPSEDGINYFYKSVDRTKWTLKSLPDDFEEMQVVGTAWKSLSQVALKRSNLGGQLREGGHVTYPSTELRLFVQDKKDEFDEALRVKAMIYSR